MNKCHHKHIWNRYCPIKINNNFHGYYLLSLRSIVMRFQKSLKQVTLGAALAFGLNASVSALTIIGSASHLFDIGLLGANGGHTLGGSFSQSDSGWTAALGGSFGSFDAIVINHNPSPGVLSASTISLIGNYVSGGGRLIVGGGHGAEEDDFLNAVFGYSVSVATGCGASQLSPITKTAAAAGTSFASAPTTIFDVSCTTSLVSLSTPSTADVMYTGLGGDVVWMDSFGAGVVGWYGWDFCCGSIANENAWYSVLDSALTYTGEASVPEPTSIALIGLGLIGLCFARNRKA